MLNACNPFQVQVAALPYWCYRLISPKCNFRLENLQKGYWTGGQFSIFGFYYKQEYLNECQTMMDSILHLIDIQVIPFLDEVNSDEAWIKYAVDPPAFDDIGRGVYCNYLGEEYKPIFGGQFHAVEYPFLWKAYQERTFEQVKLFVERLVAEYLAFQKGLYQRNSSISDAVIDGFLIKDKERYLFVNFKVLLSKIQENDLDWIKNIHDTEKSVMEQTLKDELRIEIP